MDVQQADSGKRDLSAELDLSLEDLENELADLRALGDLPLLDVPVELDQVPVSTVLSLRLGGEPADVSHEKDRQVSSPSVPLKIDAKAGGGVGEGVSSPRSEAVDAAQKQSSPLEDLQLSSDSAPGRQDEEKESQPEPGSPEELALRIAGMRKKHALTERQKSWNAVALVFSLGITVAAVLFASYWIGDKISVSTGWGGWTVVCLILGVMAAFLTGAMLLKPFLLNPEYAKGPDHLPTREEFNRKRSEPSSPSDDTDHA